MNSTLLLFGLTLSLLVATQEKPPPLKPFSPDGGGFTIHLPGEPKEQTARIKGKDGTEIVNHIFVAEQYPFYYVVAYMVDPSLANLQGEDVKKTLANARKMAEANFKGQFLDEKEITLDKHPGLEFRLAVSENGVYRSRIYLVEDRLYQVAALVDKEAAQSKDVEKVLDSFKLGK